MSRPVASPSLWKPLALLGAVVILLVLAWVLGWARKLGELRDGIQDLGAFGPVAFVAIFVVASLLAVPGSALTLAAGSLFGSVLGIVLVSVGSTLGAAACFLVARHVARDAVASWLSRSERFRRLDELTRRQGALIVALTRLAPFFPYNLLNYAFGLTRVRFSTYVLWSWLCMLPWTVLYVVGTDAIVRGLEDGRVPWALLGIVAVIVVGLWFAVELARRRLQEPAEGGRSTEAG